MMLLAICKFLINARTPRKFSSQVLSKASQKKAIGEAMPGKWALEAKRRVKSWIYSLWDTKLGMSNSLYISLNRFSKLFLMNSMEKIPR